MKNVFKKISFVLVICFVFSVFSVFCVNAETPKISVSVNNTVTVGETFTVTINYSGTIDIYSYVVDVSYDTSLVSCEGYDGKIRASGGRDDAHPNGVQSFSKSFTFKANKTGSLNFSVVYQDIVNSNADEVTASVSGASVSVAAPVVTPTAVPTAKPTAAPTAKPTSAPTAKPTAAPTAKPTQAPTDAPANTVAPSSTIAPVATPSTLEVVTEGTILEITDKPESVLVPAGFTEITYTYGTTDVWAAINTTSTTIIMYLKDTLGDNSGFYVYDELQREFSKYIVMFNSNNSFTIMSLPEGITVPEGFVEKIAILDGISTTVWVPENYKLVDIEYCEFWLLYAMNSNGQAGFYLFDQVEETFQRYNADFSSITDQVPDDTVPTATTPPDKVVSDIPGEDTLWQQISSIFTRIYSGEGNVSDWFILVLLILVIVLIILLVIFIIYAVQKHKEENEEDEIPLQKNKNQFFTFENTEDNIKVETVPEEYEEETDSDFINTTSVVPEGYSENEAVEDVEDVVEDSLDDTTEDTDDYSTNEPVEVTPEATACESVAETVEDIDTDAIEENKKKDELFDFTFENFNSSEASWNFDNEIGEDFFDED